MDSSVDPQCARAKRTERREKHANQKDQSLHGPNDTAVEEPTPTECQVRPVFEQQFNPHAETKTRSSSTQTFLPYKLIAAHAALAGKQRNLMLIENTLHAIHRKKEEELEASRAYKRKLESQYTQDMLDIESTKAKLQERESVLEQFESELQRRAAELEHTHSTLESTKEQVQKSWKDLQQEKERFEHTLAFQNSPDAHPLTTAVSYLEQARLLANFEGSTKQSNVLTTCLHALDSLIHRRKQTGSDVQSVGTASTRASHRSRSHRRRPKFSLGSWKQR